MGWHIEALFAAIGPTVGFAIARSIAGREATKENV
jgi:hypothetical protein